MWTFKTPEIIFGEDSLSHLDMLIGEKALIVTDVNMVKLGLIAKVQEHLEIAGIASQIFDKVEPDPTLQIVREGQAVLLDYAPDWVIAVGGGSSLDAAKAMWFLYERPEVELEAINPFEYFAPASKSKLIAISTTSGTGADVSMGVVVSDTEEFRKLTLVSKEIMPTIAIVDPEMARGLPPRITADTGMDVLSHAIEAFITPWSNHFTDGLCLKAIELVFEYLPRAYADGNDMEAREAMHNASSIAGIGLNNASLALAHPLAHSLGGSFHTPHGRTVGMFLPYTLQFAVSGGEEADNGRFRDLARYLNLPHQTEQEAAQAIVEKVKALLTTLEQPQTIAELGIEKDQLEEAMIRLVDNANADALILTSPRQPDDEEIEKLFLYAFDGQDIDF